MDACCAEVGRASLEGWWWALGTVCRTSLPGLLVMFGNMNITDDRMRNVILKVLLHTMRWRRRWSSLRLHCSEKDDQGPEVALGRTNTQQQQQALCLLSSVGIRSIWVPNEFIDDDNNYNARVRSGVNSMNNALVLRIGSLPYAFWMRTAICREIVHCFGIHYENTLTWDAYITNDNFKRDQYLLDVHINPFSFTNTAFVRFQFEYMHMCKALF